MSSFRSYLFKLGLPLLLLWAFPLKAQQTDLDHARTYLLAGQIEQLGETLNDLENEIHQASPVEQFEYYTLKCEYAHFQGLDRASFLSTLETIRQTNFPQSISHKATVLLLAKAAGYERLEEVLTERLAISMIDSLKVSGEKYEVLQAQLGIYLMDNLHDNGRYVELVERGKQVISVLEKYAFKHGLVEAHMLVAMGYGDLKAYTNALEEARKALEYYEQTPQVLVESTIVLYDLLSLIYNELGQYKLAESFGLKAVTLAADEEDLYEQITLNLNMGGFYGEKKGRLKSALEWFSKCEVLAEGLTKPDPFLLSRISQARAVAFLNEKEYDSAAVHINKALKVAENLDGQNDYLISLYITLSQTYGDPLNKKSNPFRANFYMQKARQLAQSMPLQSRLAGELELVGATNLILQGLNDSAVHVMNNFISREEKRLDEQRVITNRDLNLLFSAYVNKATGWFRKYDLIPPALEDSMRVMSKKAMARYRVQKDPFTDQRAALRIVIDVMMEYVLRYWMDVAQGPEIDLIASVFQMKHDALSLRLDRAGAVNQEDYDSVQVQLTSLKNLEAYYSKELLLTNTDEYLARVQDQLFEIRTQLASLKQEEKPSLTSYRDIEQLKNSLKPNELYIDWFVGYGHCYGLFVTDKEHKLIRKRVINTPFKNDLNSLAKLIGREGVLELNAQKQDETYELLTKYYQILFEDATEMLQGRDRLIISPHGVLQQLPFELLVTSDTTTTTPVFLMEEKDIRYTYSWEYLVNRDSSEQVKGNASFAAFVLDEFEKPDTTEYLRDNAADLENLTPLPFAAGELNYLQDNFQVKSFGKGDCSEDALKTELPKFDVLHFGTHAMLNNDYPQYSFLLFESGEGMGNEGMLDIAEIMNLDIDADLVVLSACNTGSSQSFGQNGMISMAYAFQYAGAGAVVTSKWKIPDQSSFELMTYFYEHLALGERKSEALKNAKLDYLENQTDELKKHPYYWAGFVLVGDDKPVRLKAASSTKDILMILALVFILTLTLFMYMSYRQKLPRPKPA